ncbi:Type I restriction-modification system specificity subunit [Ligilactobacillus salivarius GJ-24]|uniref:Type I restriction-modification system specificity subunit n=1 Tax=Ligilactobacillus salivarius GJ-24 TaxID=1041521 RepID=F7QVB3_9LACO|nr:restriction endonuclease subunit S [Ligilactobacillus salivarius]EGM50505.1 Type I restriction-modification system specificity subunit [Ligilactobacillus salivarius GJ-24]
MFPTQFTGASFTWEQQELGAVVEFYSGLTYKPENVVQNGTLVIRSSNIHNNQYINADNVYVKNNIVNSEYVQEQDIVVVVRNGSRNLIGKHALLKSIPHDPSVIGAFMTGIRSLNNQFIEAVLNTEKFKREINKNLGATINQITTSQFKKMKFNFPKREEDKQIGILFNYLDDTIQLHENYLQLLYNFRSFLLQKMFSINDTFPNLRFKQFNDKWKYKKLGEVADIVSGGTPDTTKRDYWNGSINWYTPAEVGNKIFVGGSQRKITNIGLENSSAKILPVGTVLFTSRAGIGKTAILKEKGSTNQGFQSIVPKKKSLDSYFIFSMSNILKKYGESHGAGSTFLEISGKELAKARISLPSITEQKNISKVLFKLDTIITLQKQEIDNLKKLKQFLLQNMFI